jgi:hypothetical protein
MNFAPVALFVFNRPEHTERTINSLLANPEAKETDLIIYSDGWKNEDQKATVNQVRDLISNIKGFKSVKIYPATQNLGLAKSIITGVTEQLKTNNEIIVLEDDMVVSTSFLEYMNFNLTYYKDEPKVASIHGYCYPVDKPLPNLFFQRGADCWGWGTWARAWSFFEPDGKLLLSKLQELKLVDQFDHFGAASKIRMLNNQINGRVDSWAIRWDASVFLKDMLTLYPGKSLVKNIGADGGGTHTKNTNLFDVGELWTNPELQKIPVKENHEAREIFTRFYLHGKRLNPLTRIIFYLKSKNILPRR